MTQKIILNITMILLISNVKSFSQYLNEKTVKNDTIVLKSSWISQRYYQRGKRIFVRDFKFIMQNDQTALGDLK